MEIQSLAGFELHEKQRTRRTTDLEVQVEDVHLVHVLQALTDLPDEGDGVKFH